MQLDLRVRRWLWVGAGVAVFFLYFFQLAGTGTVDPDEPRYASIGREMVRSGDWITPRLWGQPWFEKPALLYWMTGAAYEAGLPDDWAPRLPVALASAAFLVFFWFWLRRAYGEVVAWYGSLILATSAGWLAYSRFALTDLPLAVCFGAAMLLTLDEVWVPAGILLGLAVLAKSLVPYVLFVPALWFFRRRMRGLAVVLGVSLVVAAPWYVMATVRNGTPFLNELFVKHQFGRAVSGALQHGQPVWYYLPVLLGGLFPWTPVVVTVFRRGLFQAPRERFLAAWVLFGFVFFSLAKNKLPGYLLPLMPGAAALLGLGLAQARSARWVLAAVVTLFALLPTIAAILPGALAAGLSRAYFSVGFGWLAPALVLAACVWWLDTAGRREWAVASIGAGLIGLIAILILQTYPVLDQLVSPRSFWRQHPGITCADKTNRTWRYGLNYYARKMVPDCN